MYYILCILQQTISKKQESSKTNKLGIVEKKLLVIFFYFVILAASSQVVSVIIIKNHSALVEEIQKYFLCEQQGHNPKNLCKRSEFERLTYSEVTLLPNSADGVHLA